MDEGGGRRIALSRAAEVEDGARVAVLLAEGVFRLDVAVLGDTLRTVVRNLSDGRLEIDREEGDGYAAPDPAGAAAALHPARTAMSFTVGDWHVEAQLALIETGDPGLRRVTGQAVATSRG